MTVCTGEQVVSRLVGNGRQRDAIFGCVSLVTLLLVRALVFMYRTLNSIGRFCAMCNRDVLLYGGALFRFLKCRRRHATKDKTGSTVASYNAKTVVIVQGVNVSESVSTNGATEGILHDTRFWIHAFRKHRSHEPLDRKQLRLCGQAVIDGRMLAEQGQPRFLVGGVRLNLATRDPDGIACGVVRVGDHVTVCRHGAANGAGHILVGGIWVGSHWRFNRERGDDAVAVASIISGIIYQCENRIPY